MNAAAEVNSKEFHQAMAMLSARAVRASHSPDHKQQARRDCLSHLRASLRPVAAERAFNNATQES